MRLALLRPVVTKANSVLPPPSPSLIPPLRTHNNTRTHSLNSIRHLSVPQKATVTASAVVSPSTSAEDPAKLRAEIEQCYGRLDLSFTNTKEAFKSKSNTELLRAVVVLKLCTVNFLVQNNQRLLGEFGTLKGCSLAVLRRVVGASLFKRILKASFYGQFVAGETQQEVEPVVARLAKFGVKSILDYSVESDLSQEEAEKKSVEGAVEAHAAPPALKETGVVQKETVERTHDRYSVHREFGDRRLGVTGARTYFYEGEHQCDKNMEIFCDSIDAVANVTHGAGFAAIKITALGRPQLLLKLSESIAQTQNFFKAITGCSYEQLVKERLSEDEFMRRLKEFGVKTDKADIKDWFKTVDFDADGFVDFQGWRGLLDDNRQLGQLFQVLNIKTGKLEPLIQNLTDEEEQEFANMKRRTVEVAKHAISRGVRIMVDAEQTYFQPAISRLTVALMRKFNQERGNIFNTYQAYLKGTLSEMEVEMQLARREGWHFGAKLVRGAYMDQERKRAAAIGYEDPVNESYEATSRMYERCLTRIADEYTRRGHGNVSVMVASHNADSIRFAVKLMKERGIAPSQRVICFAQLYGMCDQVSFSLGQAGYSVYKYLPYGPVEEVLPYLSRRALENGSLLKLASGERELLTAELFRRLKSGQFRYKVPLN